MKREMVTGTRSESRYGLSSRSHSSFNRWISWK